MKRKRVRPDRELTHVIAIRVTDEIYQKLAIIQPNTGNMSMSMLLREILENRTIKVFTHDLSFDPVIEELREIRKRIRSTGLIINDYTRSFNSSDNLGPRELFAKLAFSKYGALKPEIDRLLELINLVAERFLDGEAA